MIDEESSPRTTVADVAQRAGVSTATVDRVLNRRAGVRKMTAKRVLLAAAELGYIDEFDGRTLQIGPKSRIAFVLPKGSNRYLNMLGRMIVAMTPEFERFGLRPTVEYINSFNPGALAKALTRQARTADGIAFMGIEHPVVRETVSRLAANGLPLVTLISDTATSSRLAYFGLDNRAAGRMAGYLIGRFVSDATGKVAMIAGSLSYRAHGDRELGFLDIVQEMYPGLRVVGPREGRDDENFNYRHMRSLLLQHPDLKGIYNIGGGASGVGKALKHAKRESEIVFVGHGLTTDTREFLVDGTMDAVINQDAHDTIARCVSLFAELRAGRRPAVEHEPMRIEVVFRENLTASRRNWAPAMLIESRLP